MQSITCEQYKALVDAGDAHVLLDVREQDEWDAGHIDGARHLSLGSIETTISEVVPDKDVRLIVQCRRGSRSKKACPLLTKLGYTNVTNLDGGYLGYCAL